MRQEQLFVLKNKVINYDLPFVLCCLHIEKYFDHIHTVQDQPMTIHKKLNKLLVENLNEVLAMYNRGVRLTFTDIRAIKTIMEKELNEIIQRNLVGDNCILLYGGANRGIEKPWIDELSSHFEAGDYLLLQNEISNLPYIMEKAIDAGVHIILNPSPMDQQVLDCPVKQVDYIILNEIEAAEICGLVGKIKDEQLAGKLAESFPHTKVILTLGEKGALYLEKGNIIRQESFHVPVVDTTAAGDTFTGYFFGSILSGMKPETALQRAAKAAAIAVTKKGAAPSIPEALEVDGFFSE